MKMSFAQQGEDLIFQRIRWEFLRHKPDEVGRFVDIGSFDPIEDSNTYLLYRLGWSGLVADISSTAVSRHAAIRPRDIAVHVAVTSETGGEISTYQPVEGKSVHATLFQSTIPERFRHGFQEVSVATRTLDSLLQEHWDGSQIDFLTIDVEGSESLVLDGFDITKFRPHCIAIESHGIGLSKAFSAPWVQRILNHHYTAIASSGITHFLLANEFLDNKQTVNLQEGLPSRPL